MVVLVPKDLLCLRHRIGIEVHLRSSVNVPRQNRDWTHLREQWQLKIE